MKTFGVSGNLLRTMLAASFALSFFSAAAEEPRLLADTSEVRLTVRDNAGQPIRNAKVDMLILSRGRDQGTVEVTTNDDGAIEQDIIPLGDVVQMQITAPGYQAYGVNYPVNSLVKSLVVRLNQQPVTQVASNALPNPPSSPAQATFTYKEAQWVKRTPHHAARKAHPAVKNTAQASAKPSASQTIAQK